MPSVALRSRTPIGPNLGAEQISTGTRDAATIGPGRTPAARPVGILLQITEVTMHAIVVYESYWGNTAKVAKAIAEGIGDGARACATDEAAADDVANADLIVAGSPVFAFGLPTEKIRENLRQSESTASPGPDLSHPSLRSWLDALPRGRGRSAAFETRLWWSPRGATGTIEQRLSARGYPPLAKAKKFVVQGGSGPLREGELERAKAWGQALREAIGQTPRS